jgi:hypothetical protein
MLVLETALGIEPRTLTRPPLRERSPDDGLDDPARTREPDHAGDLIPMQRGTVCASGSVLTFSAWRGHIDHFLSKM